MSKINPRLQLRGGRYFIRVKVPADLRSIIGKQEFHYSLRTSELSEARRQVHLESVRIDSHIAEARRKRNAKLIAVLTQSELEYLALDWFAKQEKQRSVQSTDTVELEYEEAITDARSWISAMSTPDNPDAVTTIEKTIGSIFLEHGIQIDPHSVSYRKFYELIRRGHLELSRRDLKELENDFSSSNGDALYSHAANFSSLQTSTAITLAQLIERYESEPSRSKVAQKTKLKQAAWFRVIKEVVGANTLVNAITRAHASTLLELLSALPANAIKKFPGLSATEAAAEGKRIGMQPMSPTSAKGYFTAFTALMRFAMDRGYRNDNPADRLKVRSDRVAARHRRNPFSNEQLNTIFNARPYLEGRVKTGPQQRNGQFWVPLIALFSGMRLNEICQLEVSDITTMDGTQVILVRGDEDNETKRVKSEAGNRYAPLHPVLVRIGLLDHHKKMSKNGQTYLFPDLTVASTGYRSDNFSKWFSRFLKSLKIKTKRTSFHSFRHNYRDALREANISEERVRALGGWSSGRTEEIYGSGLRPSTLAREIRKVHFPDLDLSHLTTR